MTIEQLIKEYKTMDRVTIVKYMLKILIGLDGSNNVFRKNVDALADVLETDIRIYTYAVIAISYLTANGVLIPRKIISYRKDFGALIIKYVRNTENEYCQDDVNFVKSAFGMDEQQHIISREQQKEFEPLIAELQCYIVSQ